MSFVVVQLGMVFLRYFVVPFRRIFTWRRKTSLPVIEDPLLLCSAKSLAERIRKRDLTSEEVIKAYIERIKAVEPILNAVIDDRFEDALLEARQIDLLLQSGKLSEEELAETKPLLGVPVTIKESCSVKGLSLAVGCRMRKGLTALEDGEAVARLRDAGAIVLLVSSTPEFCLSVETSTDVNGKTCNAYHNKYTSGGSSGGEGALIGAGASILGIGSDLGGSVRIPAMFNGIFGHKPTARVVPTKGHYPIADSELGHTYAVIGPLVRYAEDLRLSMRVLNKNEQINVDEPADLSNVTLYYMNRLEFQLGVKSVKREIMSAVDNAVDHLKKTMKVSEKKFDFLNNLMATYFLMLNRVEGVPDFLQDPVDENLRYNRFKEFCKSIFSRSVITYNTHVVTIMSDLNVFIPIRKVEKHEKKFNKYKNELKEALGDDAVLVMPTFPTSAFRHSEADANYGGLVYTLPFNLFGFPSTQVPMGFDGKGLPIGIQVIAAPNQDNLCISVAEELGRTFGGWVPPSPPNIYL